MASEPPASGGETLLQPRLGKRTTGHRERTPGLSDRPAQSVRRTTASPGVALRVRVLHGRVLSGALVRAGPGQRCCRASSCGVPGVIAIAVALLVAIILQTSRVPLIGCDDARTGFRSRQQLRHRRRRVPRSAWGSTRISVGSDSPGLPCGRSSSRWWSQLGHAGPLWPPWHQSARCRW